MRCPACEAENEAGAQACFTCGRALDVLTRGLVLSGRYEVRRHIGSGGMGRVYEAFDRVLEEPVALKVLRAELTRDPDLARRFLSEIRLARKVSHRNVCRIHEYNEDAGIAYISMEYIEGRSLKQLLQSAPLSLSGCFDLALQAAQGLAAIHEHGIVHRDLKTQNIMVDTRGVPKILDFGIAKQVEGGAPGFSTSGSQVFGTPEYMSPEQVAGVLVDARSDIYALGCVTYEIFTGRPPFQAEAPHLILLKHLQAPPPLGPGEPGLPPALLDPLSRALAKDPASRYSSTADYIAAIQTARQAALGDAPGAEPVLGPAPSVTGPRTRALEHLPSERPSAPVGTGVPRSLAQPRKARWVWVGSLAATVLAVGLSLDGLARKEPAAEPQSPPASVPPASQAPDPVVSTPPTAAPTTPPATSLTAPRSPQPTPHPKRPPTTTRAADSEATAAPEAPGRTPTSRLPPFETLAAAAPASATPPAAPSAPTGGTLSLIVVPDAEVVVDDTSLGTLGRRDIPLSPGQHTLRILHPDYEPLPRRVTIRAGETLSLLLDLAEKGIPRARR